MKPKLRRASSQPAGQRLIDLIGLVVLFIIAVSVYAFIAQLPDSGSGKR